jgi:hypothetical protein
VLDAGQGVNGDELSLTITLNSADSNIGGAGVLLESDMDGHQNFTVFAVGQ